MKESASALDPLVGTGTGTVHRAGQANFDRRGESTAATSGDWLIGSSPIKSKNDGPAMRTALEEAINNFVIHFRPSASARHRFEDEDRALGKSCASAIRSFRRPSFLATRRMARAHR
jgi:hypothetical protein